MFLAVKQALLYNSLNEFVLSTAMGHDGKALLLNFLETSG